MINETEIKKLDVYFTGKFLIDEKKDIELKEILREIIEERYKFKQMIKETEKLPIITKAQILAALQK